MFLSIGSFPAMTRVLAFLTLIATAVLSLAEEQSQRNKSPKSQSSGVEPALVTQNLSDDRSAGATGAEAVARSEKKLAEAQADAKGVDRLCKTGVLSKVEKELRLLKVIQCEAELANARLAEAKGKAAELELGIASGESTKDEIGRAHV